MKRVRSWDKKKKDLALNLSELSEVSGWDRGSLAAMNLPLEKGKITYSDFRRILQRRQDAREHSRLAVRLLPLVESSGSVSADSLQAVADKFDAPSRKHANKAA